MQENNPKAQRKDKCHLWQRVGWIGVVWGILLLLTVITPWGIYGEKPYWSIFFFINKQPAELKAMLVSAWIAGLLAFVAGLALRGLWQTGVYLVAGGTALILFLCGTQGSLTPWLVFMPLAVSHAWLAALAVLTLAVFLVITGIRVRSVANLPIRLLQGLAAAGLMAFLVLAVCDGFGALRGMNDYSSLWAWLATIFSFTVAALSALGCFLVFQHAWVFRNDGNEMTLAGRNLVLAGLMLLFVWGSLGPAIQSHRLATVFGLLNNELLVAGLSLILIEGLIGLGAWLPLWRGQPSSLQPGMPRCSRLLRLAGKAAAAGIFVGAAAMAFCAYTRHNTSASQEVDADILHCGDWPQWCGAASRNMVSGEKGLPSQFDELTKEKASGLANVKWVAPLGTQTLGSPVIANGKVFIGGAIDVPGSDETLGMLWCFQESDGKLLWRLRSPYIRWLYNRHSYGICATPTVEGDRVYLLGHLGDVLCLNANGMAGGNQGPFIDEPHYFATGRKRTKAEIFADGERILEHTAGTPATLGRLDADVIWRFDMLREVNCWPFNALNASILIRGDRLYVATCSTLSGCREEGSIWQIDEWKKKYHKAEYTTPSPSLIVLDKNTGKLLARDTEGIFMRTFHGAHASPTLGTVNGKELLFYGGGDGACYAFDPDFAPGPEGQPGELKLVWKFNCLSQASYGPGFRIERLTQAETIATPVFYKNRIYTSLGNDLQYSGSNAKPGRLVCIDATQKGDITSTGRIWSFDDMRSCASTVAIVGGLLYTADASGVVYCFNADTGQLYWTHQTAPVWSSPLAVDGKVYVGTHRQGLLVFEQGREKKLLAKVMNHADIVASPTAANGVLYLASQKYLYALELGKAGGLMQNDE